MLILNWSMVPVKCTGYVMRCFVRPTYMKTKRSYRKQIARKYVEGICCNSVTLKSRLGATQSHWKWHHSINRIQVPISFP